MQPRLSSVPRRPWIRTPHNEYLETLRAAGLDICPLRSAEIHTGSRKRALPSGGQQSVLSERPWGELSAGTTANLRRIMTTEQQKNPVDPKFDCAEPELSDPVIPFGAAARPRRVSHLVPPIVHCLAIPG